MKYESFVWIYALLIILAFVIPIVRTINIKKKIKGLADNALEITPQEFFKIRNASNGGRGKKHISTQHDFAGVDILYNHTKNMYYVGQGVSA